MDQENLSGVVVPLLTPLGEEGEVDERSLRALVEYVISGGVHGLFVMGTTGEFQFLSRERQKKAIGIVIEEAKGRVPVVAGVTGFSVEETVYGIASLEGLREPPFALVVAPLVYHSNRGLPQHMERMCALSRLPIILYNNIGIVRRRWKYKDILPPILGRISRLPATIGMKDSSGDMDYFRRIRREATGDFAFFQGDEGIMDESLREGAAGIVPSLANVLPGFLSSFYRMCKEEQPAAREVQRRIRNLRRMYVSSGNIPAVLKEWLRRKKIISSSRVSKAPDFAVASLVEKLQTEEKSLF